MKRNFLLAIDVGIIILLAGCGTYGPKFPTPESPTQQVNPSPTQAVVAPTIAPTEQPVKTGRVVNDLYLRDCTGRSPSMECPAVAILRAGTWVSIYKVVPGWAELDPARHLWACQWYLNIP